MRKRKSVWFLILGLLIVLAGCGGNGGNGSDNMGGGETPPPTTMVDCADGTTATSQAVCDQRAAAAAAAAAAAVKRAEALAPIIARPDTTTDPDNHMFDGMIDRNSPNCGDNPAACGDRPLMVDGNMVSVDRGDAKFTMSSDTPSALMGFAGSIHTQANREAATATMPRITDEVTVYTNQEDATPTPFSGEGGVYMLNFGGEGSEGTKEDPHTAFSLGAAGADLQSVTGKNGAGNALVNISQHRPSTSALPVSFGKDAANAIKSLNGMFDMAPGTYECATTCTVTIDKDGKLSGGSPITGTVTFVPASGAMVPAPDTNYLTFGYWVSTSTPMTGDATTTIAPFATGKDLYDGTDMTAYLGTILPSADNGTVSATYTGQAAGQFVHKTDVDGDSKGLVPTSSGAFTADANLTANFTKGTDGNLGANFQNAIHGTVSNFKNGSGDAIEGWELTLDPAKFDGSNTGVEKGGFTFSAGTSGGKDTAAGGWRGSFYGPATGPDGPDADENRDPIQPGSVAGEFLGHFANGHAVGAFGATKDKE